MESVKLDIGNRIIYDCINKIVVTKILSTSSNICNKVHMKLRRDNLLNDADKIRLQVIIRRDFWEYAQDK